MLQWLRDPVVADGIGLTRKPTKVYTFQWIEWSKTDDSVEAFAILVDHQHVGNVVLDKIDRKLGTSRLSIYIGEPTLRGRGIGTKATSLALDHAFHRLGLHEVWLDVHTNNIHAIRAYSACGFAVKAILKDGFTLRGARVDALRMTIVAEDRGP